MQLILCDDTVTEMQLQTHLHQKRYLPLQLKYNQQVMNHQLLVPIFSPKLVLETI